MESKEIFNCKICNRDCIGLRGLSSHLAKFHKFSIKSYYDKHIKKEQDGICLKCGKTTTFKGMMGYTKCCSLKCSNASEEHIKLQTQTNNIKYNGTGYQSELLRQKTENTLKMRYGITQVFKLKNFYEKCKQTWIKNLGVDNPSKSQLVKDKKEKTSIKNRGKKNYLQTEEGKQLQKNTLKRKYGDQIEYVSQIPYARQRNRENQIKRLQKQIFNNEPMQPCIGKNERICLDELEKYTQFKIHRNLQIIGYFPDGYIKELNLLIEYDERGHFIDNWTTLRKRDIIRENDLKQELNCEIFRIKDCDWINNKQFVIKQFQNTYGVKQ